MEPQLVPVREGGDYIHWDSPMASLVIHENDPFLGHEMVSPNLALGEPLKSTRQKWPILDPFGRNV